LENGDSETFELTRLDVDLAALHEVDLFPPRDRAEKGHRIAGAETVDEPTQLRVSRRLLTGDHQANAGKPSPEPIDSSNRVRHTLTLGIPRLEPRHREDQILTRMTIRAVDARVDADRDVARPRDFEGARDLSFFEPREKDIRARCAKRIAHERSVETRSSVEFVEIEHAGHQHGSAQRAGQGHGPERPRPPPAEVEIGAHQISKRCRDLHLETELFKNSEILGVELGPFEDRRLASLDEKTGSGAFQEIVSPMAPPSVRSSASVGRLSARAIASRRSVGSARIRRSTVGENTAPRM